MINLNGIKNRFDGNFVMPLLFLLLNIFLYTPFHLYINNLDEYGLSFVAILKYLSVPFGLIALVLLTTSILLPLKRYEQFVSVLFALGLLVWIQGNILVWQYGLFNGQDIDWTLNVWRGWVDSALWLIVLIFALIYYKLFFNIAAFTSCIFLALQTSFFLYLSLTQPEIWEKQSIKLVPPSGIFEFSNKQNVIHIVLDGFQSSVFKQIVENNSTYYKNSFDGFTFYSNTTGSFPTTYMSIPASLSGKIYKNNVPMKKFVKSIFDGDTIISSLQKNGFETDFVPLGPYLPQHLNNFYSISDLYGFSENQYAIYSTAHIIDLIFFRVTPHFVKRIIYNDQLWLCRNLVLDSNTPQFQSIAHRNFMVDFLTKMSVSRNKPVYKFLHLATSHTPLILNSKGEYVGETLPTSLSNYINQDTFALSQVINLIEKLKVSGVYNNSLIILQSDHGAGIPINVTTRPYISGIESVVGSALPLLAIKPPHSTGELKFSDAEVMLSDIPATVSSLLNLQNIFNGRSTYDVKPNESRERKFYHYFWEHTNWQDDYFKRLTEYTIKGNVYDGASWQLTSAYPSPQISFKTSSVNMGTDEGTRFLRTGWSFNESSSSENKKFNWALGKSSSVFLSIPKNAVVKLTANVKYAHLKNAQNVTVRIDGKIAGYWKLAPRPNWQEQHIIIMPDKNRPDFSVVEFLFSETSLPVKIDSRQLSLLFSSISVESINTTLMKFGVAETSRFLESGWGINETLPNDGTQFNWALGKSASVSVALPKNLTTNLTATVQFPQFLSPQKVTILVDGKITDNWTVTDSGKWETHSLKITPDLQRPDVSKITFYFSQSIKPTKNDGRSLSLLFNKITLNYH